jgi:hypothetical protein
VLELIGAAALIFVGWKLVRSLMISSRQQGGLENAVAGLTKEQANAYAEIALDEYISYRLSANPGAIETNAKLEKVVYLLDQASKLDGTAHGPAHRAALRIEITTRASELVAQHRASGL